MPNRMLRDWTSSETVDLLDFRDEVFFTRLIMKADDYGRFSANPKLLRSLLFPLKDGLRDTDISRSLAACQRAGLIRLYSFEEKPLLEIVNFGQRLKHSKAKYPSPEEGIEINTLPGSSGNIPPEEKRSRREVEGAKTKARALSEKEIVDYCLSIQLPMSDGTFLWEKWEANGWVNGRDKIKDWKGTVRSWKAANYLPSQKQNGFGIVANNHRLPQGPQRAEDTQPLAL